MEKYINTIIIVTVIGGIVTSIVSENSKLKKYISLTVSLICVIALLSPIANLIFNKNMLKIKIEQFFNDTIENEIIDNSNNLIIENGVESIENGIRSTIIERFSINEGDIKVKALIDDKNIENIIIKSLEITLYNSATWSNGDEISKYINSLTGIEVNVKKR